MSEFGRSLSLAGKPSTYPRWYLAVVALVGLPSLALATDIVAVSDGVANVGFVVFCSVALVGALIVVRRVGIL